MPLRFRYSRWDGSQQVFDVSADDIMEQVSNDLLQHGDLDRALRDLMRRGLRDPNGRQMPGLRQFMEQLRQQRQQQLQRYDMDSVVDELREQLKDIIDTERKGIQQRLDEAAKRLDQPEGAEGQQGAQGRESPKGQEGQQGQEGAEGQQAQQGAEAQQGQQGQQGQSGSQGQGGSQRPDRQQLEQLMKMLQQRAERNRQKLDSLPKSAGGQIKELNDYDFMSPEAAAKFKALMDQLKGRMMQNFSKELKDRIQNLTPEQMAAIREMLRQLNQMLRDKAAGRQPNFQQFMEQFGPMFGPNPPQSLEELMEQLARQSAQMQSMLESMSPEARRELQQALSSVMDPETERELGEFMGLMEQMMPMDDLRRQYPFMGDEELSMDRAMDLMRELQDMDEMERALQEAARTGKLDGVDPEKLKEMLGEEARRSWDALEELRKKLEEAGYVKGDKKLELTPRGIRRIGQKALQELFQQLKKDRQGSHRLDQRGITGDALQETKPYEFGDPFQIHLEETLKNALARQGPHKPVHLMPEDFQVYRNELYTRSATVLLLDQSRSMGLFGSFQAAKKVALALYALIHGQFARDSLYIIGFSDYAQEIKEKDIATASWNAWVSGTNIHHALMLSRKLLSREKTPNRQVILITDGEPTAHLEGDRAFFSYPPTHQTLMETLKEVRRCTQEGITINSFMLESNYQLVDFIDQVTRINRGRAFYTTPDQLGRYVLVDYVNNRRKRVQA